MQNKRGKRGKGHSARRSFAPNPNAFINSVGRDERPAGLRTSQPVKPKESTQSTTGALANAAHFFESALVGESREAHVIPRKGITDKQCLRLFEPEAEYEVLKGKRIDAVTGEITEVIRRRRVWQGDKTLLRRGNPFAGERNGYKREGVIRQGSNTRKYVENVPHEKAEDMLEDRNFPQVLIDEEM